MSVMASVHLQVYTTIAIPEYLMTTAGTHATKQPGVGHNEVQSFLLSAMQNPELHRYVSWSFIQQDSGLVPPAQPAPKEAPA